MRRHAWAALLTVLVVMVVAGCRQSESQEPTPSQGVSATGGQRSVPANWPERLTLHVIPSQAQGPMQEAMNRLAAQLSREVGVSTDVDRETVEGDYRGLVEGVPSSSLVFGEVHWLAGQRLGCPSAQSAKAAL